MTGQLLGSDTWIVNQLMGIKVMEKELSSDVADGGDDISVLHDRVAALNSWLDLLDSALGSTPEPRMARRRTSCVRSTHSAPARN